MATRAPSTYARARARAHTHTHAHMHARTHAKKTGSHAFVLDSAVELKHWLHPAHAVTIKEVAGNEASVQAYTDGSKHGQGVGSGAAIFMGNEIVAQIKLKLDNRCSNN